MKGETYLYAANALAGADDAGLWKASDLMSVEIIFAFKYLLSLSVSSVIISPATFLGPSFIFSMII